MEPETSKVCPICARGSMASTTVYFDLDDVLTRWEKEIGFSFSAEVWSTYANADRQRVRLYHCVACDFSIFLPVVTGTAAFYKEITLARKRDDNQEKWEFIRAVTDIKRYQSRQVLDVGCGYGYFLEIIRKRVPAVNGVGYELSQEIANIAKTKDLAIHSGSYPDNLIAEYGYGAFDTICMFQVLEHVADPAEFLKATMELLTRDGILIISVPDASGPIRHFSDALTEIPPHHVSRWCEIAFRMGMPRLGLEVVEVKHQPLPSHLWDAYLPVMFERDFFPAWIGKGLNESGFTKMLIRMLNHLNYKWLRGIPGHSLYAVARRTVELS